MDLRTPPNNSCRILWLAGYYSCQQIPGPSTIHLSLRYSMGGHTNQATSQSSPASHWYESWREAHSARNRCSRKDIVAAHDRVHLGLSHLDHGTSCELSTRTMLETWFVVAWSKHFGVPAPRASEASVCTSSKALRAVAKIPSDRAGG